MMRKNNLLSALLGQAALLLMAATALVVTSCSQDNEKPGGTLPEGRITLVPTVAPVTAWNAGDNAPGTRADGTIAASLTGGEVWIGLNTTGEGSQLLGINYYSVDTDGKLTRLPFDSRPNETEAPLSVDAPGEYTASGEGVVTLTTDGISYRAAVRHVAAAVNIGADGKLSMSFPIESGGLRLDVKNTDGTAYTGADITAKPLTVTASGADASFDVKTLTAAAPAAIWGDISSSSSVNTGDPLLELVTGGKTYHVNAPRQISFTGARLYTFKVRVGATGITVSSDDLGVADFEAVEATNVEAELVPLYEGQKPNLLAIPGQTAYWVAPVNADNGIKWENIDFNTICPAGWYVPTKDEFVAMTGIPADENYHDTNYAAIVVAFPDDYAYWSSTDGSNASSVWSLDVVQSGGTTAGIIQINKASYFPVRCVRAK